MEVCSLKPSSLFPKTTLSSNYLSQRCQLLGHFDKFFKPKLHPCSKKLHFSCIRAQLSSGVTRVSSTTVATTQDNADSEVKDTVFVAGATGKVGSRTVRELLKKGFQVRAGVRSAQRAETLIQSVKEMKLDTEDSNGAIEKLEIVECDLEKRDQIVPAIGSASVVICCIGASEKEIFDITGPFRIDYQATKNLVDAARAAKAKHFILVTSLGTNKIGFPAAILNLFWGVLIWKRKAELELIASGLPYTIVRPGGMERPTDSYKETHNITLSEEDTLFGGQVSNLQVAELLSVMAQNRDLSYCKIVEVVAETTAPLTPMEDLLAKIPSKRKDMSKPKQLDVVVKPLDPEPVKSSINEAAADVAEEETVQVEIEVAKPTPLSPYTAYDDLKPPTSPTPTAPTGQIKEISSTDTPDIPTPTSSVPETEVLSDITELNAVISQKPQPLSPYTAYEDLKPPSSPCPSTPSNSLEESSKTPKVVDGVPNIIVGTQLENDPRESTFYHSPFPVYDDLRPPTSPTPTPPNSFGKNGTIAETETETSSISADNGVEPSISTVDEISPVEEQNPVKPKPRPLSPYAMYDDLKPPCSPMPSPKKL
ncbi:protein TIC 62, chloroplastic isoform X2 [Silene latifolia]|uniref:protein TIC 62, chloroplastic isoform X2 n=1 Tax=Silene latifolia TaxID=37657 RepID=UPI003D76BCA1